MIQEEDKPDPNNSTYKITKYYCEVNPFTTDPVKALHFAILV